MRVAILADIHGNLPACEAVLDDIKKQAPDYIVAAGDLALRGAHPKETVDLLFDRCNAWLMGNTDCYIAGNYLGGAYREKEHWKTDLLAWTRNELGDARVVYSHGPKFWSTLNWSGSDDKSRVRVIFEDLNDQQHSVTYEGPWAWFRLQDRSRLSKTSVANVYLATYSVADGNHSGTEVVKDAGNHMVRFEIKGQSANNPLNKELLGGFRCIDGL